MKKRRVVLILLVLAAAAGGAWYWYSGRMVATNTIEVSGNLELTQVDLSFKTAGRIAFRKAMEQAKPTLLEPIMKVEITIPDEFAGSIMGDLNSRRGRIQGMDNKAGKTVVKAECPMAEMLTYGADLTSMTQGRGSFNMEMSHYDFVPAVFQEKIIANYKAERGELVEVEE